MLKLPTNMLRTALGFGLCSLAVLFATHARASNDADITARSEQMILVVAPRWDSTRASLRRFEREAGKWRAVSVAQPVVIGKSGSAWGLGLHSPQAGQQKREGDGRAPAGIFAIGPAFGYAPSITTALEYQAMNPGHYCIDVSDSPLYNRIVDTATVGEKAIAGSTEPMRRDLHADGDQRYKLGFVIEHNAQHKPGGGSCIFAHLWKSAESTTAGCTAMNEVVMRDLLGWLNAAKHPLFVLLPEAEYRRLQNTWRLPEFDEVVRP